MQDYLKDLNEQQRAAVSYLDGPALVIAGAGSGKTRVLTYKIVYLLEMGLEPWRIMALTFTNKAAREMRERIEKLVGTKMVSRLWMGTFHSIFARILRANAELVGFKSNFTIYDTADSKALIKTIVKDVGLDEKIYKPSTVASTISWAKNALISPEAYAADRDLCRSDANSGRGELFQIYRIYRDRCVVAGAMDFDDLLYYTNVLLRDNPGVLRHYRDFFRYVLVDEYQDTNFVQHLIVKMLTEESGNVTVVGDDAQSIYSFRGANIRNILELKKTYPTLATFKLEQNYRSTLNILEAANSLIAKNTEQIPKHIFSDKGPGNSIEVVRAYSDLEESFLVANRISQIKMRYGDPYSEFAVLYRTNAQSRILEEQLRKRNIPYRIYGGLSFYQRKEVKDAIAYFRLAINPGDDEALKRIINFPARGIGGTTLNKLVRAAIENRVNIWAVINNLEKYQVAVNSGTARKLGAFARLVGGFIEANSVGTDAYELATRVISETGLLSMLLTDRSPENISRRENIEELLGGVRQFVEQRTEAGEEDMSMGAFMSEVSLATDQDSDDSGDSDRVTLMTVHAAKGLEFSNIFIVGVEEDLFPSSMSMGSPQEIEEERRLLYVAITRAKRFCMMSYAGSRFRNGQTMLTRPSRFIDDIDDRYLNFVKGTPGSKPTVNPISNYRSSMAPKRSQLFDYTPAGRGPAGGYQDVPGGSLHDAAELSEGMTITHKQFGRGRIKSIDDTRQDTRIVVDFENTGTRTLMLRFAKFTIEK